MGITKVGNLLTKSMGKITNLGSTVVNGSLGAMSSLGGAVVRHPKKAIIGIGGSAYLANKFPTAFTNHLAHSDPNQFYTVSSNLRQRIAPINEDANLAAQIKLQNRIY